jgi:CoA:oxalate CoA-transferase
MSGILEGIRVVDFTQAIAGPLATRIMAGLGADVIKIEMPAGDLVRWMGYEMFGHGNAGKRCVSLDLKSAEGMDLVRRLVAEADVVMENWRPGVAAKLGLDYHSLLELKPDLIMCSVSGYGQSGPLSGIVGADPAGQAISGMAAMIGEAGEAPYVTSNGIADTSTAVNACLTMVAALYHREKTGRGQHIDVAMSDVMLFMDTTNTPVAAARRGTGDIPRTGRHHPVVAPYGVFKATDGYVVIEAWGSGRESLWGRLCAVMGRLDLLDDPRLFDIEERREHLPLVIEIIEDWLATLPSRQEAVDQMVAAGVVAAPILTPDEAVRHPIYADRAMVVDAPDPSRPDGVLPMIRVPYRFSESTVSTVRAPGLGEHNDEVLSEVLGLSADHLADLHSRGVLHRP